MGSLYVWIVWGNGLYGNCIQLLVHGDEDYWVLYELIFLLKIHNCLLLLEMHISSNTITKRTASQSTHDIAVFVCLETGMILHFFLSFWFLFGRGGVPRLQWQQLPGGELSYLSIYNSVLVEQLMYGRSQ